MGFRGHLAKGPLDEGLEGDPAGPRLPLGHRNQFSVNPDGKLLLHTGWDHQTITRIGTASVRIPTTAFKAPGPKPQGYRA